MRKVEIATYCGVNVDNLTKVLPNIWILPMLLILIGCHGNRNAIVLYSGERCGIRAFGFFSLLFIQVLSDPSCLRSLPSVYSHETQSWIK